MSRKTKSFLMLMPVLLLLMMGPWTRHAQAAEPESRPHHESEGQKLLSEGNVEEAEEQGTEAFKHSKSVRFIKKITGLSLDGAYWMCVVLNFAVIAGLITWGLKKSLPTTFKNRTASIQKAMAEARAASEDANRRLSDIESRLSRLDSEIAGMRTAAEKEAAAEEERIKTATADDVRKVINSAEQEIAAAAKNARRELRAYAANLVVSLAEKQIKVDPATDQFLVRGFAQRLASSDARKDAR